LTKNKKENDMNTKQISMVAVMALVLVTAAVSPSLATAQQKETEGKFTLPCTTYWGASVLPAGSYTFTISRVGNHAKLVEVRGEKSLKTMAIADPDNGKESALEIRRSGGSAVVTNMRLAGQSNIVFGVTRVAKELLASGSTPNGTVEKITMAVD
jgi:hypothetical protein